MGDRGSYADRMKEGQKEARFDPMLEEVWNTYGKKTDSEMLQQDAETTVKAVLDALDLTSNQPHPLNGVPGEKLPGSYSRCYAGLLLRDTKSVISVSQDIVKLEMDFLAKFDVIGCFVEGRPPLHELQPWLDQLQIMVGGKFTMGRSLGKGFLNH